VKQVSEQPLREHERDLGAGRERRLSFGSVAEQYDRYRPSYPVVMVEDVIAYAGARPGDRALEVGAGTGRATLLFARRGLAVTALEPDAGMAAVASRRAATAGTTVDIVVTDFEQYPIVEPGFRLLFSGTAWHWVTPVLRNRLAARALVPGGALAAFWNRPVWEGNPLRLALDAAYVDLERTNGKQPGGVMNPRGAPVEIRSDREWLHEEFRGDGDFVDLEARHYRCNETYTSAQYVALIGTHSDHILLPARARTQLDAAITDAIDAVGGSFELTYETLLCLARRAG
jgi:SAM-dependent methyltransferase